jgi:hypothetical protein
MSLFIPEIVHGSVLRGDLVSDGKRYPVAARDTCDAERQRCSGWKRR